MPELDVMKHALVPKHEILSEKGVHKLLKKYRIKAHQLPKIKVSDPAAGAIEAKPGNILKITRESPTAGKAIAYRYVIKS
ncbi:MAG: DNA-directed RNA polymerase subunit H [Candidatus Hadarchaeota archaeon]|nr:DNA-directed RNA polymerase subunit H [Candidatus Hadarchaeota archaeon]